MASPYLQPDENRDLGFGSVLARESRTRLMNRDGSYNVVREGMHPLESLSLYHFLLTVTWPRFLGLVCAAYVLANAFFGLLFTLCGPGALSGTHGVTFGQRYAESFFFSVHTFATIGYGSVAPASMAANLVVTVEALVGLLVFALATGVVFSRFSRPVARIIFSRDAVVAPYRGVTAFQFRMVNGRSNQIIEMRAKLTMNRLRPDGSGAREFHELALERDHVPLLPMSWTLVHPIDPTSPLYGVTDEGLRQSDAEFFILLTGIDETFAQAVHARSSYKPDEVVWGARFTSILHTTQGGMMAINVGRIHEIERVELPGAPASPPRLAASTLALAATEDGAEA
ncbi:MAG: channel, inward rectifier [Gemmatimonadetes bacterium]|nr:channel, inward rectifier [Gemmatimonadota bacterium]